ncbi:uncharacterized protein LOC132196417 [Neocloeon triangulifer]|uniref:uncharacterized protein LOC132196417 n=1 Tax=Neocloeon triangulifer TaxID=2078957 RepID=UPI00286F500E|nr:uncharacterized protein LOC132196417 [Neocloeon triangulifer]
MKSKLQRLVLLLMLFLLIIISCSAIFQKSATIKKPKRSNIANKKSKALNTRNRMLIIKCCGGSSCVKGLHENTKITAEKFHFSTENTSWSLDKVAALEIKTDKYFEISMRITETTVQGADEPKVEEVSQKVDSTLVSGNLEISQTPQYSESFPTSTTIDTTTVTTSDPPYTVLQGCSDVCKKNESFFLSQGSLIDADDYGYWVESCGSLFLWGSVVVNWQENVDRCCSIGMTPIMIENDTKRQCLINLAKPPLWKYNAHYWTSGRRISANATFQWCLSNSTFSNVSNIWQSGQPDNTNNTENCVHLNIDKTNGSVATTDKNCSNLYVFGCQGSTTPAPPCFKPQCVNFVCEKNPSYFYTLPDGKTMLLTKPSDHGYWYTVNGRTYLFSTVQKSWLDAQKECCSIGMKLLSIEYEYEYASLIAAAKNLTNAVGIFWTSGTDEGCEGKFGWCAVNQLVRDQEAKWQTGEPNNYGNNENCIYLDLSQTSALLIDSGCSRSQKYICEARDTTKTSSNSEAILDECGAAFNVSKDETKLIFNSTQYSLKIKCFLKCAGENGGFMLNGKLIDKKILELAESLAISTTSLQENMAAVSSCGSKRGMDECDTASIVYQCGKEKAPELVANIINTVEANSSSEYVPLPSVVHKCLTDYECVMDKLLRDDYDNNRPIPNGEIFFACGIKYLHQRILQTYQSASSFCCKYGLKLAYFENSTNVNCLVSSTMSSAGRAEHSWLAASRLGSGKFGWCTSSLPFTAMSGSIADGYPDRSALSEWFLLSVNIGADLQNSHFAQEQLSSNCYALCRP